MFLLNSRSHRFSATSYGSIREGLHLIKAHLLPKLRCQFAEFLLLSSLKRLRIFILPTCVGLRYGPNGLKLSGFSWKQGIGDFRSNKASWSRASVVTTPRIYLGDPPTRLNRDVQHPACITFSVSPSHQSEVSEY